MTQGVRFGPPVAEDGSATSGAQGPRADKLRELLTRARTALPEIALDGEVFVADVAKRADASGDGARFLESVPIEDLYLAAGVLARDDAALRIFDKHLVAEVGTFIARVTTDHELVEEVKQELRERVIVGRDGPPKIAEYSGKGALGGWVRIVAVRIAMDRLRARGKGGTPSVEPEAPIADPELAYVSESTRRLFREAFVRVLAGLEKRERSLLRLHYVDGLTLDQLSRMYKIPRSTLARRVDEIRKEILSGTEQILQDEHRLSPSEVASVVRSGRSQVHLTLAKLLQ